MTALDGVANTVINTEPIQMYNMHLRATLSILSLPWYLKI